MEKYQYLTWEQTPLCFHFEYQGMASWIILIAGLLNVQINELDSLVMRVKDSGLRNWYFRPITFLASKIKTFYANF